MRVFNDDEMVKLQRYGEWCAMLAKFRGGAKAAAGLPLQPKGATPLLVELLGPGELFKLSFADQAALCERLAPGAAKVARKPNAIRVALQSALDYIAQTVKDAESLPVMLAGMAALGQRQGA